MKRVGFLTMVLAAAVTAGCGGNDQDRAATADKSPAAVGTSGDSRDANIRAADREFVRDVAIANMAEMDMARTALQRASDANVKKFAQMMVDDHSKAGTRLQALVLQHHMEMPVQVDEKHKDVAEKLGKTKGGEFDREYADAMVDGHQDFVDRLEARIDKDTLAAWKSNNVDPATGKKMEGKAEVMTVTAEKSDNPVTLGLNQWAAETYPVAFAHLQAAKDLQKGVKRRTTTP